MPSPLPAHSDDNDVRAVRRRSAHARNRNRVRNPAAARLCDRRRIACVPGAHALHHASRIHLHGQDRSGLVGAESRQAFPSCQRGAERLSDDGNCLLPGRRQESCATVQFNQVDPRGSGVGAHRKSRRNALSLDPPNLPEGRSDVDRRDETAGRLFDDRPYGAALEMRTSHFRSLLNQRFVARIR